MSFKHMVHEQVRYVIKRALPEECSHFAGARGYVSNTQMAMLRNDTSDLIL